MFHAGCGTDPDQEGAATASGSLISDQVHSNGTKGFFFAPPIAPIVSYGGKFESRLSPEVRIQRLDAKKKPVELIALYTATKRFRGEKVRRRLDRELYLVRFHGDQFKLDTQQTYRIEVYVGGKQLGFADIDVVATSVELKKVDRANFVGMLPSQTLPIKFRIEKAAVDRDGDGVFDWLDNCPTVKNPPVLVTPEVTVPTGTPTAGCDPDRSECDPAELDCNPPRFQQPDADHDGIGDACECSPGYAGGGLTKCSDINECAGPTPMCDPRTICTNTAGSFTCSACPAGFTGTGKTECKDIDECAGGSALCSVLAGCVNTAGSYQCGACPAGYTGDGKTCTDVNECAVDNGGCDPLSTCTNVPGSFKCAACPPGFTGGSTGCTDIDECAGLSHACDPQVTCTNTLGSYQCGACPAGFKGDGHTCTDVDECAQGLDTCSQLVTCANTVGGYQCGACPFGYEGDGHTCTDVDECAVNNGGCSPVVTCTNVPGTFVCGACPPGFSGNGYSCSDINECQAAVSPCDPLTACTNVAGGFLCGACPSGYTGNGKSGCLDVDECAQGIDVCSKSPATTCSNTAGSYQCGACPSGYAGNGKTCTDVNECATDNGGCDSLVACTNTPGGFVCGDCPAGYTGGGLTGCLDIDECHGPGRVCDPLVACTNKPGSFICGACPLGYTGDGAAGCLDVDECAAGSDHCSRNPAVSCGNKAGGYTCGDCPTGYTGDGFTCTDVNECATNNGGCHALVPCTNTVGSFACGACPPGYSGDGVACTDIDECLVDNGGCDPHATCTNIPGSRQCGACPAGYLGTGAAGCVDVDECAQSTDSCSRTPAVICTNTAGSYTCGPCPSGYVGNGMQCGDINECLTANGGCDALVMCMNAPGAYSCGDCPAGYTGGGATGCTDVNECVTSHGGCDPLAACINMPGSVSCGPCPAGFVGSGVSCVDQNECLTNNGGCGDPAYATCINNPGGPPTCHLITACPVGPSGNDLCATPGTASGTPCNDGNACTQVDTCQGGVCVGGIAVSCASAGSMCGVAAACDSGTGSCGFSFPAGSPCLNPVFTVTIGNGPSVGDHYLNAGDVADVLLFTDLTVGWSTKTHVIVEEDVDLSFSNSFLTATTGDLELNAPTVEVRGHVKMGQGLLGVTATTLILDGTISNASSQIAPVHASSSVEAVQVVSQRANLQQALDFTKAGGRVRVGSGIYPGNFSIKKPVRLTGAACGPIRAGAAPGAPVLVGQQVGGTVLTITAIPGVTIDGFRINGQAHQSAIAVAATAADNLTVLHNSFDGLALDAVSVLFGSGVSIAYNVVSNPGTGAITVTTASSPNVHDNVVVPSGP